MFLIDMFLIKRNMSMSMSIFLDLKKAFDTVDHTTLLLKLRKYGITSTSYNWFTSYLTNREQFAIGMELTLAEIFEV